MIGLAAQSSAEQEALRPCPRIGTFNVRSRLLKKWAPLCIFGKGGHGSMRRIGIPRKAAVEAAAIRLLDPTAPALKAGAAIPKAGIPGHGPSGFHPRGVGSRQPVPAQPDAPSTHLSEVVI
jgi:hypothetical protein